MGRDTVAFSAKLPDSSVAKKVLLRGDDLQNSPFGNYLRYDSTLLKIFAIQEPLGPRDSLRPDERGLFSRRWAVTDGKRARYLNISDLGHMGLAGIGPGEISDWITGGRVVQHGDELLKMSSELKKAGIIDQKLPPEFRAGERYAAKEYLCLSVTIFYGLAFTKYSYLISPSKEIMLWKREEIPSVPFPPYIPLSGAPGVFTLKDPGDSAAAARSTAYREILFRHIDRILE